MTDAPQLQGRINGVNRAQVIRRSQQSTEEEWQEILNEVSNDNNSSTALAMPSPPLPTTIYNNTPRRSIETSMPMDMEQQMSISSSGSTFSFHPQETQDFNSWFSASIQPSIPPSIPEYGAYDPPQTFAYSAYDQQPTHRTAPPTAQNSPYLTQEAEHFGAEQTPMLSEGSPYGSDFAEEGWARSELPQTWAQDNEDDVLDDLEAHDPCYAILLHRCLMQADDYTLSLRELYDWVKENSQKAKDAKNKGWQNSVRHNLSMNAVRRASQDPFDQILTNNHRPSSASRPASLKAPRREASGA